MESLRRKQTFALGWFPISSQKVTPPLQHENNVTNKINHWDKSLLAMNVGILGYSPESLTDFSIFNTKTQILCLKFDFFPRKIFR